MSFGEELRRTIQKATEQRENAEQAKDTAERARNEDELRRAIASVSRLLSDEMIKNILFLHARQSSASIIPITVEDGSAILHRGISSLGKGEEGTPLFASDFGSPERWQDVLSSDTIGDRIAELAVNGVAIQKGSMTNLGRPCIMNIDYSALR